MRYRISNTQGRRGAAWDESYETVEAATEAISEAMGWDLAFVAIREHPQGSVWSVYEDEEDADVDAEGAYIPLIEEISLIHAPLIYEANAEGAYAPRIYKEEPHKGQSLADVISGNSQVVSCPECGQLEIWSEEEVRDHGKCRLRIDPCDLCGQ